MSRELERTNEATWEAAVSVDDFALILSKLSKGEVRVKLPQSWLREKGDSQTEENNADGPTV